MLRHLTAIAVCCIAALPAAADFQTILFPDMNDDGVVNIIDYYILHGPWDSPAHAADLFVDGRSNTADWIVWWDWSYGMMRDAGDPLYRHVQKVEYRDTLDVIYDRVSGDLSLLVKASDAWTSGVYVSVPDGSVVQLRDEPLWDSWLMWGGADSVEIWHGVHSFMHDHIGRLQPGIHHLARLQADLNAADFGDVFHAGGFDRVIVVPEPATGLVLAVLLGGLAARRNRGS